MRNVHEISGPAIVGAKVRVFCFIVLIISSVRLAYGDNTSNMMGLGMPGPLASQIGQSLGDGTGYYYGAPYTLAAAGSATTLDVQSLSTATTVARFGRPNAGSFQSLVEIRNKQLLTGFSGIEAGRGAIRLNDTIAGKEMEIGFYQFGAGIFTNAGLLEIWAPSVSVRHLSGSTPAYFEVRDANDEENLAMKHDSTDGIFYTSGNSFPAGAISMRPQANETFRFEPRQTSGFGNLVQGATYGGSVILTRVRTVHASPVGDALTAAGSSISDALQLTGTWNNVSTVAASTGVKLFDPSDANSTPTTINGFQICVRNGGANNLKLYPPTGSDQINGLGVGNPATLTTANNQIACCFKTAATKYFCTTTNSST